jgi:transcriptional regulator with XRE-family HTH domain
MRRGLTQAALAELADQDLTYVQRVERGITNLSVAVIVALADALDTSPASLFRASRELARPTGRPKKNKARRK